MLDIQELEPRSRAMCVVRELDRAEFDRICNATRELAAQNERMLEVASGWIVAKAIRHESEST